MTAEALDLKKGINRIGRSFTNDFMIVHDTLSRFHCQVEVKEDSMWVLDLDSSNGTFVDEEPLEDKPVQLKQGQELRLGDVTLEVKEAPEPKDEGDMPACANHPTLPASTICVQCKHVFCGACVHILKLSGGRVLRLCPMCSGHCETLVAKHVDHQNFIGTVIKKFFKKEPKEPKGTDNKPNPFHE